MVHPRSKYRSTHAIFVDRNCHNYESKCTRLTHLYTWYLLRGNQILILPSSTLLPSPHQSHLLYHINPPTQKLLNLTLIKPTQYMSTIKLLCHFETTSYLKYSFPHWIPLIPDKIITWGEIPVKEGILSVTYHGCLTSDSDTIILGRSTEHRDAQKHFFSENFQ